MQEPADGTHCLSFPHKRKLVTCMCNGQTHLSWVAGGLSLSAMSPGCGVSHGAKVIAASHADAHNACTMHLKGSQCSISNSLKAV